MSRFWLALSAGISAALLLALPRGFAQEDSAARGKYLVEQVAKCQDCHTPKMESGSFIMSQWMKGAAINLVPAAPVPGWKTAAPDITPSGALWKRWNEEGMVSFLETGKSPRGTKPGAPMPTYTLSHQDALAIVAFLKSIQ